MPRYYFHTEDGPRLSDEEGAEFPDIDAAKHQAVQTLGEMLRENAGEFWGEEQLSVIVRDGPGLGEPLYTVTATGKT